MVTAVVTAVNEAGVKPSVVAHKQTLASWRRVSGQSCQLRKMSVA